MSGPHRAAEATVQAEWWRAVRLTPAPVVGGAVVAAVGVPAVLACQDITGVSVALLTVGWVAAVVLAVGDLGTHRLPNRGTAGLAIAGVLSAVVYQAVDSSVSSIAPVLAGGAVFAVAGVIEALPADALGGGDAKLFAALGVWTGLLGWSALVWAFFGAHLAMILVLVVTRLRSGARVPLGPAIVVGVGAAWILAATVIGLR